MPEAEKITDLMKRIREGDQDAAAALVKQYEPLITPFRICLTPFRI